MTPNEIASKAKVLQTKEDLLGLINAIRKTEDSIERKPLRKKSMMVLCNPDSKKAKRYRTFYIPKKSGGKREISAPEPALHAFLWPLDKILKSLYEPTSSVMGFTYGRSIVDNAKAHLGQIYILNLDLENFFPSIKQARIWKRLQVAPYNFNEEVASVIAGLCSYTKVNENGEKEHILPQGAPTSPVLTNIICERLDRRLMGVAKRFNLRYTRYADDITFSSMHSVLNIGGEAYEEIKKVIEEQGFVINTKKTRLQKLGARQEVTGLILSEKVNTPRSYVRGLDQLLYVWEKFGYKCAFARLMHEEGKKAYHKKGVATLENVIGGKLDYLKMVKGAKDKVYLKYYTKYQKLKELLPNNREGLTYIATYTVEDFKKQFDTDFSIAVENENFKVSFRVNTLTYTVRLTNEAKKVFLQKENDTKLLYLSLCKDKSMFWLMHLKKPEEQKQIDIKLPINKLLTIWEKKGIDAAIEAEIRYQKGIEKKKESKGLMDNLFSAAVLHDLAKTATVMDVDLGIIDETTFPSKDVLINNMFDNGKED